VRTVDDSSVNRPGESTDSPGLAGGGQPVSLIDRCFQRAHTADDVADEEELVTLYGTLARSDQQTLRLAPLWMFSALVGRTRLETWELDAIWDAVRATLPTTTWLGTEALQATLDDPDLVAAYERDGRPVTTGLLAAATVSARLGAGAASSMRSALLAVGEGVARARGPFGRSISRQDADTLELLAEIMDLSDADPHRLFAFV
jgi:hypothetical protein